MSVPIKRLQELARHLPVHERRTVERFMEFVIADSEDRPTIDEIAMIRLSQAEIDKDEVVAWEPRLEAELERRIAALARRQGRNKSALVRRIEFSPDGHRREIYKEY